MHMKAAAGEFQTSPCDEMGASSRHALAGLVLDLRSVPPTGIVPTLLGSSSVEENWLGKLALVGRYHDTTILPVGGSSGIAIPGI